MNTAFWTIYALAYDTLSRLRPYREMLQECAHLLAVTSNHRVLDVGCGTGNLLTLLAQQTNQVVGVDISRAMIARAREKLSSSHVALEEVDLSRPLPYDAGSFDRIACVNTLHALPDPRVTLRELGRILKDGGLLALSTPLPKPSPLAVFREHLGRLRSPAEWLEVFLLIPALFVVFVCNLFMLGQSQFFTQAKLEPLLNETGFVTRRVSHTYAGQNILILAERKRNNGKS